MGPPLGIEPSSRVLQTRAEMTTLAQAAYMVLIAGFEPAASFLPRKRSSPDLYQHVMEGGIGFEPMYNGIKIRGLTRLGEPPVVHGTCSWVRTRDLSIIGRMLYQLS